MTAAHQSNADPTTFPELLARRAIEQTERRIFTFLSGGEQETGHLTYGELDRQARVIAAEIAKIGARGERVLLVYPTGLDFVSAFFGCLYAGAVAVPAPPPDPARLRRTLPRIEAIVEDASPVAVLTTAEGLALARSVFEQMPRLAGMVWIPTDSLGGDGPLPPADSFPPPHETAVAFLQYTSGSTSAPKGTEITHGGLVANSRAIRDAWGFTPESVDVVWVPNHHDDGLVHGLLQPVFGGSHGVLLPPVAVIQRPRVWLEAISRYRATHSGGPNFGYEIARRKVPAECLPHLDLSSWTVAYNAAEPVRPETLESFRDAFAPCGFRWTTFQPCYGLAESTLLVTSKRLAEEPRFLSIDIRALEREHRVVPVSRGAPGGRTISSCGAPVAGTTIAIADPRSGRRLSPGTVGEIWLAGPSCARGYWGKPEATAETFGARLADGEGPFLRTGDLGFLLEGELYVTGRLKDVIILRGQNHHAHDLEWAIQSCHPAIRPGSAAAFPVEEGGEERVAMVVEADPRALGDGGEAALAPVYDAIREAVSEAHGVTVHAIAILRPGALPKTSSGKVQRGACAAAFRAGELDEIGRSLLVPEQATPAPAALPPPAPSKERTQEEVAAIVAEGLTLGERRLDPDTPFGAYGLDSVSATALAERLGERFGLAFAPSLLWNHPTLASLAAHIAERLAESRCPPATGTDGAGSGSTAPRSIALPREAERRLHEPIAVLGMSLRVPGANDAGAFWSRLAEGFDGIREVPPDRWDIDLFHDPDRSAPGRMTTRWGGFLDCAVDRFDPTFFAIAPREAEHMDPQQRLLLEVTWEALEEAGIVPESLQRSATGVFVGICGTDYRSLSISDIPAVGAYDTSGNACSIVANRLSYIFDLRGPSFAVDTACSSGLLALHLACRSLRARECDMAIVGATNLVLTPHITISFSKFGAMAPDGRCKTFDERADGYVRGEGIVSVILKRLSDVRPGDPVLALIRGTATNQDGTTAGLTAPNGLAQQAVIRLALEDAGTDPAGIGFVECHGTGTALGDPIEVEALAAVYGQAPGPVALGALKSSVGHLEGAAGLAGMAKAVLALQRGAIPPNLHFRRLNPQISFAGTSFYVPTELRPWPRGPQPRLAAVSSFGFGGSNVHVILEEPPPAPERGDSSPPLRPFLLPVSAKTPEALGEAALLFAGRVRSAPAGELSDICHTASLRRSHHEHRLVAAAEDGPTLAEILEAFSRGETRPGLVSAAVQPGLERRIAFVFSGQGSQWPGMARALFEREPAFREAIERCEIAFRSHVEFSLRSALMEGSGEIERIDTIQPTLFAVQVALAALWQTWGIEPDAVVGHSMGEVAAAHVAGALTLDDAARVICRRSRLLLAVRGAGAMAMVELGLDEARQAIRGLEHAVSVAAANSPRSTILSGDRGVLAEILGELEARGVFCRWVKVDVASHSPQMDPLRKSLLGELDGLRPRPARIPIYSTVLASPVDGAGLDADYWSRNLREPVLFAPAVSRLVADGHTTFVELAPHPILAPAVEQCLKSAGCRGTVVGSLRRDDDDRISMLVALGALHASGVAVPFERLYPDGGRIVPLPAYPWQRDRYWLERPPFTPSGLASRADGFRSAHPFLGAAVSSSLHPEERLFEPDISTGELPYLKDHQVLGRVFFPAAGFIEAILAAGLGETPAGAGSGPGARIEDLRILTPLDLSADTSLRVQVASKPSGPGAAEIRIASAPRSGAGNPGTGEAGTGEAGSWTVHATATFHLAEPETGPAESQDLDSLRSRLPERIAGAEHYRAVAERGLAYGPAFQGVEEIARRDGEALARIRLPKESSKGAARYRLHPALLDACLQAIAGALPRGGTDDGTFVPAGARAIQFRRRPEMETESARIHAHVVVGALPAPDAGAFDADVTLLDDSGAVLARIEGLAVRRLGREPGAGPAAGMARAVLEPVWRRTGRRAGAPSTPAGVSWLLLLDPEGTIGERIAADLSARGDKVVAVAAAGSGAASRGFARCRVLDPWRPEDLARFLSAEYGAAAPHGIVHLWGAASPEDDSTPLAALREEELASYSGLLHLVQGTAQAGWRDAPRLFMVTRGVHPVGDLAERTSVTGAPLWGLSRTLAAEHPDLQTVRVDLPAHPEGSDLAGLRDEIVSPDGEDQIALRSGERFVLRLARPDAAGSAPPPFPAARIQVRPRETAFRLEIARPGMLDTLALREFEREPPGPGEVEIAVRAAGLNFLDVMGAMGIRPDVSGPVESLGAECAGVIQAVGPGVDRWRPGDEVVAIAPGSFASFVRTAAEVVAPRPARLTFEEAVTIPIAFMTVQYGLVHLARLSPGERVLVHSAAGGVGLAAIQVARRAGAEVLATAGSPEKRAYLESLGIRHVFDSRSLDFARGVLAATEGKGVDVVLNSLAGEAIERNFSVLSPYGRFVEIGKRDVYEDRRIGLGPFRRNLSYFFVDLALILVERPELAGALLREVMDLAAKGSIEPLPRREIPIAEAAEAFRLMARARHIGKLVVTVPDQPVEALRAEPGPRTAGGRPKFRPNGVYLITGGLGGLGLVTARWLVERGARELVLLGRSDPSPAAREAIAHLEQAGASVRTEKADVADETAIRRLFDRLDAEGTRLRGIVHAAGTLDDGILLQQTPDRFRTMAGKADGAWLLHQLTLDRRLDLFLLYSSAAGLLGSPAQGNYAAANAFLDSLASRRRALGLAGQAVSWGPWSEVGLAARPDRVGRLALLGMGSISPADGMEALDLVVARNAALALVLPIHLRQFRQSSPRLAGSPIFAELDREGGQEKPPESRTKIREELLATEAGPARREFLEGFLRGEVSRVLRLPPARLTATTPLGTLGFDSLLTLELRNRLEASFGLRLPATVIYSYSTLEALATHLAFRLGVLLDATAPAAGEGEKKPPPLPEGTPADEEAMLEKVASLSDDEALRMLTEG